MSKSQHKCPHGTPIDSPWHDDDSTSTCVRYCRHNLVWDRLSRTLAADPEGGRATRVDPLVQISGLPSSVDISGGGLFPVPELESMVDKIVETALDGSPCCVLDTDRTYTEEEIAEAMGLTDRSVRTIYAGAAGAIEVIGEGVLKNGDDMEDEPRSDVGEMVDAYHEAIDCGLVRASAEAEEAFYAGWIARADR